MPATDVLDSYLTSLPGEVRRLARGEWGLTIPPDTLGEPLDIGLSIADGLLRAKAPAGRPADGLDPWMLLWWNRQTRLVRFACTRRARSGCTPTSPWPPSMSGPSTVCSGWWSRPWWLCAGWESLSRPRASVP